MLRASIYIMMCSARNRIRVRLRRLREPRYLVGAVAGVAYLYFSVFARMRPRRLASGRRAAGAERARAALDRLALVGAPFGAIALLAIAALGWLMPFESGLLEFSEPEVAFLFPAPVGRRSLLAHRIMRSQIGLLFSAVILAVAFPSLGGEGRLRAGIAMWVLLLTGRLYFTGVSLARARMHAADPAVRRLGGVPAAIVSAAALVVGWSLFRAYVSASGPFLDVVAQIGAAASRGLAGIVLLPLMALLAPIFAASWAAFARALAGALVVLAAALAWVLASDDLFHEAASDVAHRREMARSSARTARFHARAGGVELALTGRPELAFAWKGMMQTLRIVDRRSVVRLVAIAGSLTVAAVATGRSNGFTAVLGIFATIGCAFAVLMAPQALRLDFRQDLAHLELLKTWPIAPGAIVRGEILWPAAVLTAIAWGLAAIALLMSAAVFARVPAGVRLAVAASTALVAPALILAQYTIHNAVALLFPAWVPLGTNRPRGIDAMGQRLILLGGTWLVLAAMVVPGALAGGVLWFAFRPWLGTAAIVFGAAAGASIVGLEVLLGSEALGPVFEKVDISGVERSE